MEFETVLLIIERALVQQRTQETLTALFRHIESAAYHDALELLAALRPQLIVIDVDQLLGDELALCRRMRYDTTAPLLALADARVEQKLRVLLEAGVSDVVFTPFDTNTLLLRVKTVLHRQKAELHEADVLRVGEFEINLREQTLHIGGVSTPIRYTELLALHELALHANTLVSPTTLIQRVWGRDDGRRDSNLRTLIQRLRDQLGDDADNPRYIVNKPGKGYKLVVAPTATAGSVSSATAPPPSPTLIRLPADRTLLIGRTADIHAIAAILRRPGRRVLTLVGIAGIGKTRLGIATAQTLQHDFADAVVFVPLADVTDRSGVTTAIAHQLGVADTTTLPLETVLLNWLQPRQVLLVLDNFEQIVDAAALLSTLLDAAPSLKLLITSRRPLHLNGEAIYDVPPLATPGEEALSVAEAETYSSVQLFVDRAQLVQPQFVLGPDNVHKVITICRHLDSLPLAIELTTPLLRRFRLEQLPIENRLAHLVECPADRPQRQRTLRDALHWSYSLLSPSQQQTFRYLGVFVGGSTPGAAQFVCSTAGKSPFTIQADIEALIEHSLLRQDPNTSGRLTLLPTIQDYARELLAADPEIDSVTQRWCDYIVQLVEQAEVHLDGAEQVEWLDQLDAEHDNIRAALRHSMAIRDDAAALRMLGAIWRFWYTRGYLREAQLWFGFVEQDGLNGDALVQGRALHGAGVFAWARGDLNHAKALLDTATTLLQTTPSLIERARAYNTLGLILRDQGDRQARSVLETSLALHRQADNIVGCLNVLNSLGGVAFDSGNLDEAGAFFAESYALATNHNHRIALARASANLGTVLHSVGKRHEAQTVLTQSLELGREVDSRERIAQPLHVLGIIAVEEGTYHQAGAYLQECLQLYHDLDESLGIIESLEAIAYLLASIGGYDEHALTLWAGASQARAVQQITLTPADQERYDCMLAQLLQRSGDAQYAQAEKRGDAMTRVQCIAYAREVLQTWCGDSSSKQHAA